MSMPILELAEELTDGGKLLPPKRVWVTDATGKKYAGKVNGREFNRWIEQARVRV